MFKIRFFHYQIWGTIFAYVLYDFNYYFIVGIDYIDRNRRIM